VVAKIAFFIIAFPVGMSPKDQSRPPLESFHAAKNAGKSKF
jgi:hypothetical protein